MDSFSVTTGKEEEMTIFDVIPHRRRNSLLLLLCFLTAVGKLATRFYNSSLVATIELYNS